MPPDLLGGTPVDFEAASSRRFPVGGVADNAKRPMTELVDFRLSPGASIDNGFVLSEGQPAMMTMILKGNPEKADALEQLEKEDRASRRKNETPLLVEFDLPAGVTLADCADGTVVAATEKDGRRQYRIAMSVDFDAGLWKLKGRYNWWRRMAFLVTPSVAAAAGSSAQPYHARAWLSWKGERISNVQEIVFSVIARLPRVASPKRFYIGCETASHVTGLSSAGFAAWADFITGCGLNALHVNLGANPALRDERMKALRSAGVREISVMPSTRVYNGYDICARQPPPAADRFVSHPKAFPSADGEANRARVERGLCPSAVYERRDYFMNEVVPSLRRELAPYDGAWSNWEPYMSCGKGCFCDGCRKKFAAFAGLSDEEMAKDWPEQMFAKGRHAKSFEQFQSVEHGKLMRVLNEEIAKLCRPGSDIGFVPGVAWCTMCSTWRTNGYERATSPIDYAGDFRWISPWGPYAVWMSQEPYVYSKWRNLRTFAAARDVRNQVDADYPEGKRPKLMAYPHGYQGDEWIIRPEAMEMNVDSFFFNGWQAALLYRFPNGYDQRWWAAFARSAEKAARYEDVVFDGRRCDGEVELEVTSPFALDNSDSGQWTRGLPIHLPMLQHVAYEKDGKLIVACFNFWEKAPVFFRIRRNGKDLGEFYCGALRTKVWEFGAGAAPRGFTDEDVAAWRKALSGKLARAAADDRAFEATSRQQHIALDCDCGRIGDASLPCPTGRVGSMSRPSPQQFPADSAIVPDLRVGVLSDIHVVEDAKTPWSKTPVAFFEKTLRWYREQGVDAVLVAGDLADNGKVSQLVAIGEAWKRVFPGNKGKDGRTVEKLFCYGNHDIGWKSLWEMPGENIKDDPAAAWERAFGEKWEPVSLKTVKGYPFVGVNWKHEKELGAFLKAKAFPKDRPLFVYQHPNLRGTLYGGTVWGMDNGEGVRVLSAYPNAVAFSGHSHVTLTDPRSLWQGAFTAVGTSTLTYANPSETDGPTRENIKTAARRDEHAHMPFDEMGRQGMVMEVFGAHVVLSRWDLQRMERLGADWSFDVPVATFASPLRLSPSPSPSPQFAAGAKGRAEFKSGRNYKSWWDRVGTEEPQVVVSFDAAQSPDEASRVWDYVVEAVADGRTVKTRYVYQPGNVLAVDRSAPRVTCPFPRSDFPPEAKELSFRVTPRDVRGRKGEAMAVECELRMMNYE